MPFSLWFFSFELPREMVLWLVFLVASYPNQSTHFVRPLLQLCLRRNGIFSKKDFVQYIHLWEFCQDFTWNYGGVLFESMDVIAAAGFQHKKGGLTRGTPWRSTHLYQCWSEIFLGMVIVRILMPLWFIQLDWNWIKKSSKESLRECYSMSIYPLSFSVSIHSYIFLKFYH